MNYTVMVEENARYMDESERYTHGVYATADAALASARRIVDDDLVDMYRPGMTADHLYMSYTFYGRDPYIVATDEGCRFSGREYARRRCQEICGKG